MLIPILVFPPVLDPKQINIKVKMEGKGRWKGKKKKKKPYRFRTKATTKGGDGEGGESVICGRQKVIGRRWRLWDRREWSESAVMTSRSSWMVWTTMNRREGSELELSTIVVNGNRCREWESESSRIVANGNRRNRWGHCEWDHREWRCEWRHEWVRRLEAFGSWLLK